MRVLFIEGDGDYDAMTIEELYSIGYLVELLDNKVDEPYALERQDGVVYFSATITIKEFGDVDPAFIDFMLDNFVDYDTTKARNFHILREEETE